jgi:phosphoribosyl 1,2-cyclic phosphate phosphodiesterase
MECVFLGTGAGNGVPVFYCSCDVCREALGNERYRRTRSAVALVSDDLNIVIDAPPEISAQLMREGISSVDGLFLTHDHHDHSAGLGDIEIYSTYFLKKRLPSYMSGETRDHLEKIHGNLDTWLDITLLEPGRSVRFKDLSLTPLRVSHAPGTFGYLIETPDLRTAYIPDTGKLPDETLEMIDGIDVLILDATFWGENWYPEQHMTVGEAVETAYFVNAGRLYLTHLSMHYATPVTNSELERSLARFNGKIRLAHDGLRLPLSGLDNRFSAWAGKRPLEGIGTCTSITQQQPEF